MDKKNKKLTYRMMGFVPYNISDIQKGIQFGHGVVEYSLKHGRTEAYKQWANLDKTFIILNGGPTNNHNRNYYGMMNVLGELVSMGVKVATFKEPDLNDALTAIVFLVDDRVFDRVKYPESTLRTNKQVKLGILNFPEEGKFFESPNIYELRMYLDKFKLA